MSFKHIVILLICTGLVIGCSSVPKNTNGAETTHYWHKLGFDRPGEIAENDPLIVRSRLYDLYREWQGVSYQLGGSSHVGVDCSALVKIIYQSEFGLTLPRTALSQARFGSEISRSELMPGDLVFFKTGRYSWHVGIYLERERFFHASSSKGVTISRLDNSYWKARYWKSVRI